MHRVFSNAYRFMGRGRILSLNNRGSYSVPEFWAKNVILSSFGDIASNTDRYSKFSYLCMLCGIAVSMLRAIDIFNLPGGEGHFFAPPLVFFDIPISRTAASIVTKLSIPSRE